ncbi:MAG: AtpZ/AtpI family protein [Syntrophales bacterium]|nr:AtpZ/AtpI family protein [Syntrophales bacterium]
MSEDSKKNSKKKILELAYASSLGIFMVISIFICLMIGVYLDRKFQTTTNVFTLLFLFVGIFAGFRNFYVFVRRFLDNENREAREVKNLAKGPGNDRARKRSPIKKD